MTQQKDWDRIREKPASDQTYAPDHDFQPSRSDSYYCSRCDWPKSRHPLTQDRAQDA